MGSKRMEWPKLNAAVAGFFALNPAMRLVPGHEGYIFAPSTSNKYSCRKKKSGEMGSKWMEWPRLNAAESGILPRNQAIRLVPGPEGYIYRPSTSNNYSFINKKSIIWTAVLAISLSLTSLMWLTCFYNNTMLKLVSIRGDIDPVFENWRSPPTKARLLIYIFNYTNGEGILKGEVPKVQELGPFIFREYMKRINVVFNQDGTVSFQEMRDIRPLPRLNKGLFNDTISVPNIALLSVLASASKLDFGIQKLLSLLISNTNTEVITQVKVNDFIWGMSDEFFSVLKSLKALAGEDIQPFGFLSKRKGKHHDVITMKTGNPDFDSTGIITRWNGASSIGQWGNTTCDKLEASDGSMFPARLVYSKKPLYVYSHNMCRRIPILYNKTTLSKDGFPVNQYEVARDMFEYQNNEDNKCYIYNGIYPSQGLFSNAPCANGAPIFTSFPHFWLGEKSLLEDIEGLVPNKKKHKSYFQIHERLGISLLVKTRFQLNIMLKKPRYIKQLADIRKDRMILPIAWLEHNTGDLKKDFIKTLYHLTYTSRIVEEFLKWFFLSASVGSLVMLILEIKKCLICELSMY